MNPYRALIEALQWYIENDDVNEGDPENTFYIEGKRRALAAISSAKAAEEGVETTYRIEGKRYANSQWETITLADPKSYEEAVKLADGWKSESPLYISFHETRIVSRDIRTTVISVREKEGL